ncbi:MAG TPA: ATP-dependent DNA ligase [Solirubrobacteraceae bacterium]|jgi:ATP-dependent DNA ligase|nr:ATP-dependent DNA ligase [Solirubrobacteraceae bacterium]
MTLPLTPPLAPQLALSRKALPTGPQWTYEIKLDGFRCIAFVDGEQIELQSRNGRSLTRYFPELALPAGRYVLDGEIVVRDADGREDFDALGQRIHPADSRVQRLATETPSVYMAFDLLALDDETLLEWTFDQRRAALEQLLAQPHFDSAPVELMVSTADPERAQAWLGDAEGAIAKERKAPYLPGQRKGMVKVKRVRTIDAVLVGWRPGKEPGTVGALILGLYDGGQVRTVGHCSGLSATEKRELVDRLAPYETGQRGSAEPSRWTAGRDLQWVELRPELVLEVSFDHVSAGRIRHGARLLRWRQDKDPKDCGIEQLAR